MGNNHTKGNISSWVFFTVLTSFLPLCSMLIIDIFFKKDFTGLEKYALEVIFACIVISAYNLHVISKGNGFRLFWMKNLLLFASVISILFPAILYSGRHFVEDAKVLGITAPFLALSVIMGVMAHIYSEEM